MNREQAARINQYLLEAYSALDRASRAITDLGKEERVRFDDLLEQVIDALQSKALAAIYDQYPDLEPPLEQTEEPYIDSELRWDHVRLPPSISEKDIDAIIFSLMKPRWQKVAMVVGDPLGRCKQLVLAISEEALAARLQALAKAGHIEGIGDLRKWRFSEVRLKD